MAGLGDQCSSRSVLGMVIDSLRGGREEELNDCKLVISSNLMYLRDFLKELLELDRFNDLHNELWSFVRGLTMAPGEIIQALPESTPEEVIENVLNFLAYKNVPAA